MDVYYCVKRLFNYYLIRFLRWRKVKNGILLKVKLIIMQIILGMHTRLLLLLFAFNTDGYHV